VRRTRGLEAPRELPATSPDFPSALTDLADSPDRVWIRGVLPGRPGVSIVGSRAATTYGVAFAERLAADLGRAGFAIVSGLARGIDAAAHRGAALAAAPTVAVLPGGLDRVTPRHHEALAEAIVRDGGALLAEQPPGMPATRRMFVRRNRLIAALGCATVVVEAAARSGALSTAAAAARLGRPLLAVPGDVDRETSRGCHSLLRGGARVCESAADVMAALPSAVRPALDGPEARLKQALARGPAGLDALARSSGLPTGEALALLLRLQWGGEVRVLPGQRWSMAAAEAR
jgi:DNA processing protein